VDVRVGLGVVGVDGSAVGLTVEPHAARPMAAIEVPTIVVIFMADVTPRAMPVVCGRGPPRERLPPERLSSHMLRGQERRSQSR